MNLTNFKRTNVKQTGTHAPVFRFRRRTIIATKQQNIIHKFMVHANGKNNNKMKQIENTHMFYS